MLKNFLKKIILFDKTITKTFYNGNLTKTNKKFINIISFLGSKISFPIFSILFYNINKKYFDQYFINFTFLFLIIISLKIIIKRKRPNYFIYKINSKMSFPSGHSGFTTLNLIYLFLIYNISFFPLIYLIYSFFIFIYRIRIGMHYFLDVISGILISIISFIISNFLLVQLINYVMVKYFC